MTSHQIIHSIVAACVLTVSTGLARADIVQCINDAGGVTYTDVACATQADADRATYPIDIPAARIAEIAPVSAFAAAEEARSASWAGKRLVKRGHTLDVTTLKAAKAQMISVDLMADLARQQALSRKKI